MEEVAFACLERRVDVSCVREELVRLDRHDIGCVVPHVLSVIDDANTARDRVREGEGERKTTWETVCEHVFCQDCWS